MFEKFTQDARAVVIDAQKYARETRSPKIVPMHLLVGLATTPGGVAAELLAEFGLGQQELADEIRRVNRRGGISDSDAEALGEFGIDIERIVAQVEQVHGKGALSGRGELRRGHIPFSREAKKTLELALRQALGMDDRHIGEEHLLLALVVQAGPAAELLATRDIDYTAVRHAVQQRKAS
jgi:ATP-dependent Clp protease ATP-binding subunit ClpA